jgi:UDP-3-O-[3-hydroxymyristoyl] N-acetylglucosamine deacetylase
MQSTLAKPIHFSGIGLHSGKPTEMTLFPAPVDHGIVFVRTDCQGVRIPARLSHIAWDQLQLATVFRQGNEVVKTAEHLLSALHSLNIDNCRIDLNGEEVPIMDGSSKLFSQKIRKAGWVEQEKPRKTWVVTKEFTWQDGDKKITARPSAHTAVHFSIDFDHPLIGQQQASYQKDTDPYDHTIGFARTFGFLRDVQKLQAMGLIQGGSTDNAIVLDEQKVIGGGLRHDQEFVKHKILDFLGDIYAAGHPLQGEFFCEKTGHAAHAHFLKAAFEEGDVFSLKEERVGTALKHRVGLVALVG